MKKKTYAPSVLVLPRRSTHVQVTVLNTRTSMYALPGFNRSGLSHANYLAMELQLQIGLAKCGDAMTMLDSSTSKVFSLKKIMLKFCE